MRQSDQEALWLELFTGPAEQQPALLVLPEEYYCPAVAGTKQAIDIAARLSLGLRPAWGYASSKGSGKPFLPKEELHYLSGGQKDCHAVHVHYALNRLRRLDNLTMSGTVHYTLHLMDLEHYCWRRCGRVGRAGRVGRVEGVCGACHGTGRAPGLSPDPSPELPNFGAPSPTFTPHPAQASGGPRRLLRLAAHQAALPAGRPARRRLGRPRHAAAVGARAAEEDGQEAPAALRG